LKKSSKDAFSVTITFYFSKKNVQKLPLYSQNSEKIASRLDNSNIHLSPQKRKKKISNKFFYFSQTLENIATILKVPKNM